MIVVRIELYSAVTRRVTELGRMYITNDGKNANPKMRGDYDVAVNRKHDPRPPDRAEVIRRGRVVEFPRKGYNVWRLVFRALRSAFPEERS